MWGRMTTKASAKGQSCAAGKRQGDSEKLRGVFRNRNLPVAFSNRWPEPESAAMMRWRKGEKQASAERRDGFFESGDLLLAPARNRLWSATKDFGQSAATDRS